MSDNVCDPGGFGRSLRAREHMERIHQDTGFFGLHLGWELGSSPDISPFQSHGHQWRLSRAAHRIRILQYLSYRKLVNLTVRFLDLLARF